MPVFYLYIAQNHVCLNCLRLKRAMSLPPQTSLDLGCKVEEFPCLSWTYRHCKRFQNRSESILGGRERAYIGEHETLLAEAVVLLREGSVRRNPGRASSAGV